MSRWESLLVVQGHDTRADQLTHRLATLPERAKLAEVGTQVAELDGRLAAVEERRGELSRVHAERFCELHGDVERPIAVVTILGAFERDILLRSRDRSTASNELVAHNRVDGGGEFGGGHEYRFYLPTINRFAALQRGCRVTSGTMGVCLIPVQQSEPPSS